MARVEYQRKLEALRADVIEMSELVCERFRQALEALETNDEPKAEAVITGDHEINERYLELEAACTDLIALQQPVAGDLRFITASFKIITDLERIADLATNLGEYTTDATSDPYPELEITALGEETIAMVEAAMAAYADGDADRRYDIAAKDDEIDEQCEAASKVIIQDLLATEIDDQRVFEDVSRTLLTIRDLERVGDHAVNIAARTLYMVENDDALIY